MLYSPRQASGYVHSGDEFAPADVGVLVSPGLVEIGALIQAVPSSVALLDRLGHVVLASDAWKYTPREGMLAPYHVGENFVEGCRVASGPLTKDANEVSDGILAVLEGKSPHFSHEYAYVRHDQRCWVLLQAAPIHNGLQGAIVELTDITARKRMESVERDRRRALEDRDTARLRQREADEAAHRMEVIVSLAAHELRTPLSAVKAFLAGADQRLAAYMATEEVGGSGSQKVRDIQDGVQFARQAALQVGGLLDGLLQASRARTGKLDVEPKRTDLIALVRHVVEQEQQVHPDVRLRLHTRRRSTLVLHVDPDRITQVLNNLLDNACKYSPPHQPVDVSVDGAGEVARVSVRDRGPGLPSEEQGRVWECYYQSASVQLKPGQSAGLGLGLYLARQIIEQHGGQVGLESSPGAGATFWFTLPTA